MLESEVSTNVGVPPFSMIGSAAAMGDIILTEYGVGEDGIALQLTHPVD